MPIQELLMENTVTNKYEEMPSSCPELYFVVMCDATDTQHLLSHLLERRRFLLSHHFCNCLKG